MFVLFTGPQVGLKSVSHTNRQAACPGLRLPSASAGEGKRFSGRSAKRRDPLFLICTKVPVCTSSDPAAKINNRIVKLLWDTGPSVIQLENSQTGYPMYSCGQPLFLVLISLVLSIA